MFAITTSSVITFTQAMPPVSLAPMFPYLMKAFDCTLAQAIQFTGVGILVLGFSNFLWVPIMSSFGRRPAIITSQLICLFCCVWRARATSYNSFMGASILNGIGSGIAETAQGTVIADIFFLHSRGKWNTLFWVANMGALMLAPVISGPMSKSVGWRNFWWLTAAMTGVGLLMAIFLLPETMWHRPGPSPINTSPASSEVVADEKVAAAMEDEYLEGAAATEKGKVEPVLTRSQDPFLGKGYPSRDQWKLYQPNANPLGTIWLDLWTPWKLLTFPIIEFSAFIASWSCSCLLALNLTQSQVFAAPPYKFSSEIIGFTNLAIFGGAVIGLVTAGPLSDFVSARSTIRNRGIREPEMRLPTLIPYVIFMMIGMIVSSVGYQRHWPWEVIVIIGYGCIGIQVAALPSIASTYAVDSYKPAAGGAFVAITVNKNLWGWGLSKFVTPWTLKNGFIPVFMMNMSLTVLWCLMGILFYYKGKTFRRWTRNSNVHLR